MLPAERRAFAKNLYSVTAATLGLALLCCAILDWLGYTRFVFSLLWR